MSSRSTLRRLGVSEVYVMAEGLVAAPADRVYELIADHREHHPKFLPSNFSNYEIERGGVGAGTITTFTITAGRRSRNYRMRIDEPEPGRVLTESDTTSSLVTTWTVTPEGDQARVRIETRWEGAKGAAGFFERVFAPPALRRIYNDELSHLDRYAREQIRQHEQIPQKEAVASRV
jgi:ribosome-associated toxin RatA of RatAB toxin-antitoxin module